MRPCIALAVPAMIALAGCGGGGSTTAPTTAGGSQAAPTQAEYIKKADAVCKQGQTAVASVKKALESSHPTSTEDLHRNADLLSHGVQKEQVQIERLRQLRPPQGDEYIINQILSTEEAAVSLTGDLAKAFSSADLQRIRELGPRVSSRTNQANNIAQGYGFKVCGSD